MRIKPIFVFLICAASTVFAVEPGSTTSGNIHQNHILPAQQVNPDNPIQLRFDEALPPGMTAPTIPDNGKGPYDAHGHDRSEVQKTRGTGTYRTRLIRESGAIGFSQLILGVDVVFHGGEYRLSVNSPLDDRLHFVSLADFSSADFWDLDPANPNAFGNCVYQGMYTNDWSGGPTDRFHATGGPWTTLPNPPGSDGRGMDINWDTADILVFETQDSTRIHIFELPGAPGTSVDVSAYIPSQMSGLTTFPMGDAIGVAVTVYGSDQVYIFSYHGGSNLQYQGSADLPYAGLIEQSLGIAYDNLSGGGTFYWTSQSAVNHLYFIIEFELDIFEGLYFSEDSNSNGLFKINTTTATPINLGFTSVAGGNVGLAPSGSFDTLYGSKWQGVLKIEADGSGANQLSVLPVEGLAWDFFNGILYGAINGNFFTIDPTTGFKVTDLAAAPTDIEGISIGFGGVFGIGGFSTDLHWYDPVTDSWSVVGDTGIQWKDCGLATHPFGLFAKRNNDSNLYAINPFNAAPVVVGDTGISNGGGLAYIVDLGIVFNDSFEGSNANRWSDVVEN